MSVFSVILRNLWGYDLIIFLAAAVNVWVFLLTRRQSRELYDRLRMVIFIPVQPIDGAHIKTPARTWEIEEFVRLRERTESLYSVFTNLTAIFPLLGILGTVISLLPMVADMANIQENFFAALTSTFWGLVFAIAFKLCDAFLSSRMEDNDKNVTLLLSRLTDEAGKSEAA